MSAESQTVRGRIAYVSDRAHDAGRARGHEAFSITAFADGTRTLRAACTISDPPVVERYVVQTVDAAMRPLDCFVRVRTGNAFTGLGWFRWADGAVVCEAFTAADGRLSQRQACAPGPVAFCNHAIVGDAWMTAAYPRGRGLGATAVANTFTPSPHTQGATGPSLNRLTLGLMWQGPETVAVPAGRFTADKFRLGRIAPDGKPDPAGLSYEIWVLADGSHVPALAMYRGERRYELVNYETA